MSQKNFAIEPSISITRSKIHRPHKELTTMNLGELTPIYCNTDCLPGSTYSIDLASLIRMSTPLTDIMDDIWVDVFCFFTPHRLVFDHFKEFMGENNSSAGYQTVKYQIPMVNMFQYGVPAGSLGNHLGLPIVAQDDLKRLDVSVIPGRVYYQIYNEWFRDANLIAPYAVEKGDFGDILVGSPSCYAGGLLKVAKDSDYFTRALPFVQAGDPVTIPLGTSAPIKATGPVSVANNVVRVMPDFVGDDAGKAYIGSQDSQLSSLSNIAVDLSQATSATINDLRFAFATQRLLEAKARFGCERYFTILKGIFGVSPSDASLQRPQYLGGTRIHINIDQVLSTADTSTQESPESGLLGQVGANSVTGNRSHICTVSTQEHGTLMVLACARHNQTYANGVNAMWTRKNDIDFYYPQYANLGNMPIYNKEIYASGTAQDDEVFSYQEAWSSYRYFPNRVSGYLDPNSNHTLAIWSLANKFDSCPTFGKNFIEQDRNNIKRALVTGESGPDFLCDFYFDEVAVLPMPLYSIPGLIDHH